MALNRIDSTRLIPGEGLISFTNNIGPSNPAFANPSAHRTCSELSRRNFGFR